MKETPVVERIYDLIPYDCNLDDKDSFIDYAATRKQAWKRQDWFIKEHGIFCRIRKYKK